MRDEALGLGRDPDMPAPAEGEYLPGTSWRVSHWFLVIVVFFVTAVVGTVAFLLITGKAGGDVSANDQLAILGPIQFLGGGLGLVIVAVRWAPGLSAAQAFGLRVKLRDWWAFFAGWGLQFGAAIMLVVLALLLFPGSDPPQQAAAELTGDLTGWGVAVGFITVAILAPVYEESLFRGLLLSRQLRALGPWRAYLLNGAMFAGIHVVFDLNAWFASLALFPLGVALAWMAHRSGDISRSILAHIGVNTLGAIGLFFGDELQRWIDQLEQGAKAVAGFFGIG